MTKDAIDLDSDDDLNEDKEVRLLVRLLVAWLYCCFAVC